MKYLRHKEDGTIYHWHPVLAVNPLCEPVSEEEAFPERFMDTPAVKKAQKKNKKSAGLSLSTEVIPEEPYGPPPELSADASRGLPK